MSTWFVLSLNQRCDIKFIEGRHTSSMLRIEYCARNELRGSGQSTSDLLLLTPSIYTDGFQALLWRYPDVIHDVYL